MSAAGCSAAGEPSTPLLFASATASEGWSIVEDAPPLRTVLSLDVDGGVDGDWERGALGASAAAALQRLPRDRKLPCELTLRFARAMVLRSLHASSSARHVELYTLEKVDGGGALARTYVGTARGVRRESSGGGVAYDATQTLKRPTRCDGVAVRFVSLQDDKNRAQIAAIVVRAAEAPAVSAAAAAPANKSERQKEAVRSMLLRMSGGTGGSSGGGGRPSVPRAASSCSAAGAATAPPPPPPPPPPSAAAAAAPSTTPSTAAAMMMLQHALARSEERMALSMQASLDALEARLGARFDALDSAVRVLQEEKKALQQRGST